MAHLNTERAARTFSARAGAAWRDAPFSRKFLASVAAALLLAQAPIAALDIYTKRQEVEAEAAQHAQTALQMFSAALSQSMLNRTSERHDDPAINAFNGQMADFSNLTQGVELWAAMSQKVIAYQEAERNEEIEPPRDRFDEEALRGAMEVTGVTEANTFRMSRPVILGEGPGAHERCFECHADRMGLRSGDPIGVISVGIDLSDRLALWRTASWRVAGGALALVAVMAPLIYVLLNASALQPLQRLTRSTRAIAWGDLETEIPDRDRRDEIGAMASALEVFRSNALAVQRLRREREQTQVAEAKRNEERERLQTELGDVLRSVLAGDFSARVGDRYDASELSALVSKMNEVIDSADQGRRTIAEQAAQLREQVVALEDLLAANTSLRDELRRASEAIAQMNETLLQRIGADLHDGPAQTLTYATMRMGKLREAVEKAEGEAGAKKLESVRSAVDAALREIRTLSTGLSVPQLATANLVETVQIAVDFHREHTGCVVDFAVEGPAEEAPETLKLCCYRITQEALSNGYRHGLGKGQRVSLRCVPGESLVIEVGDDGPGFDVQNAVSGLGLPGMRARVEALSGQFKILSAPGRGATVRATFSLT